MSPQGLAETKASDTAPEYLMAHSEIHVSLHVGDAELEAELRTRVAALAGFRLVPAGTDGSGARVALTDGTGQPPGTSAVVVGRADLAAGVGEALATGALGYVPRALLGTAALESALYHAACHHQQPYHSLLDGFPGIVYRTDLKGIPQIFTGAVTPLTGYDQRDFLASHPEWDELVHPDDLERVTGENTSLRSASGHHAAREYRILDRSGQIRWVNEVVRHVPGGARPGAIEGFIQEVTERKRGERELLRIRSALDDCSVAIAIADEQGRATYINTAFGALFGYTPADLGVLDLRRLWQDGDFGAALFTGLLEAESQSGEAPMVARGGHSFPAQYTGTPVFDALFEVAGALIMVEDVTERRALENQLRQSQNMKAIGQLAAGIAHEISTPTRYVGDNTRFLQEAFGDLLGLVERYETLLEKAGTAPLSPEDMTAWKEAAGEADLAYLREEVPTALAQSLEGIERVSAIVRAMRQFAHPGDAGKSHADINALLESAATVTRNEWRYVAELEWNLEAGLPAVPCLPGALSQVFLNLIVNAAHAIRDVVGDGSREKGMLRITTQSRENAVEIRIGDSGTGIPETVRDRIFDPFFTTKDVGVGTGQGLAISHTVVVEKHQGRLFFETQEGEGTTFVIQLPLEAGQEGKAGPC